MTPSTRFDRITHFVRVDVGMGIERTGRFIIDSGIGVTVVAPSVAERVGAAPTTDRFVGRRMSGQQVEAALVRLPLVEVGGFVVRDVLAATIELGPTGGPDGFDGLLGLDFFSQTALTINPFTQMVTIGSDFQLDDGAVMVPLEIRSEGPSVDSFVEFELPSGRMILMEVDLGSDCLILDSRFMADCGVRRDDPQMISRTGVDETGYGWTRRFIQARGRLGLAGYPMTAQENPEVMFQDIIHDGLIGTKFLNRFIHTFDVPNQRLILTEPTRDL